MTKIKLNNNQLQILLAGLDRVLVDIEAIQERAIILTHCEKNKENYLDVRKLRQDIVNPKKVVSFDINVK